VIFVVNRRNRIKTQPVTYEQEMMMLDEQSESDEVKDIEKDLMETDTNVDKELDEMENELI